MDIVEFFQLSSGKWFSHRTQQDLSLPNAAGGKSTVQVESLTNQDSAVIQLCEHCHIHPQQALCGLRISWTGTVEGSPQQEQGTTFLVAIADPDNTCEGKILRQQGTVQTSNGRYLMGTDDVLTLTAETEQGASVERIWFASPNLRLRTGLIQEADQQYSVASFCSEIRLGVTQPASS